MDPTKVFVFGLTAVIANAFGMGLGDYASSKSEKEFIRLERAREQWEMENNLEDEKQEMVDIYMQKGISEQDSREIVDILARHPKCFLKSMMLEELGFDVDDSSPAVNGVITFVSFLVLGLLPIIPYIVAKALGDHGHKPLYFWTSSAVGGVLLFLVGASKSKFGIARWEYSGAETLIVGLLATAIGYGFGLLFDLTQG